MRTFKLNVRLIKLFRFPGFPDMDTLGHHVGKCFVSAKQVEDHRSGSLDGTLQDKLVPFPCELRIMGFTRIT